jgi:hypothetical protein
MQQMIKKPQRVTVRQYMSPMGILNDYLAYLPTVYDLSMANEGTTKGDVAFDEADLAGFVLNSLSLPITWMNQYNMTHSMLPKSPHVLLPDLEAIEHVMNEKHQANIKAKAKEASSASTSVNGNPKKCSATGNLGEQVPKKARPAKFCQHCKNKGGPHLTHNTNQCCKYNKDSNPVAAAAGRPFQVKKPFKKRGNKQMAYLTATIEYLVKKGLKKAAKSKKRKRCSYDTSSSDSNSE